MDNKIMSNLSNKKNNYSSKRTQKITNKSTKKITEDEKLIFSKENPQAKKIFMKCVYNNKGLKDLNETESEIDFEEDISQENTVKDSEENLGEQPIETRNDIPENKVPNQLSRAISKEESKSSNQGSEQDKNSFAVTKNDIEVLKRIFTLTILIVIVTLSIVLIFGLINLSEILQSFSATLSIIVISVFMECVSIFMIFILFVKDNENAEYDNLKVIAELENHIKEQNKGTTKLYFSGIERTSIFKRFKEFMTIDTKREDEEENKILE